MKRKYITLATILLMSCGLFLNAKNVQTVETVDTAVELSAATDYHVLSSAFGSGTVNLTNADGWLFLDNIRPRIFVEEYAEKVTINGQPLQITTDTIWMSNASIPYTLSHKVLNARVNVYRHGTVIIPQSSTHYALTMYENENYAGSALQLHSNKRHYDLGDFDDKGTSFKLKRGYMATFATEKNGRGFSRVFIADTADIEIPKLPKIFYQQVSSVSVFDWQWPSKKGWCSSGRNAYNEIDLTESTWWYSWSADRPALINQEYVPIKQHGGWPSLSSILNTPGATHLLGFNEPDRPDQANATVASAIAGWEELMSTGLRIGTPAIADNLNWLYQFMDECDKRNYRVDFVAVHAYWGGSGGAYNVLTNGKVDVNKWYNKLKEVHTRTGRPLWITEWNNGANWTNNGEPYWSNDPVIQQLQNDSIMEKVLHMLDTCSFVERYSLYNWVSDRKAAVEGQDAGSENYHAGGAYNQRLTPTGVTYTYRYPDFAFKNEVVHNFRITKPDVAAYCQNTNNIRIKMTDYNGIMTDSFILERKIDDNEYEEILTGAVIPEEYIDDVVLQLTQFSRVSYRIKLLVDGSPAVSEETVLQIGAIGGNQSIRPAVARFNSLDERYFYVNQPFESNPIVVTGGLTDSNGYMLIPSVNSVNKSFFKYKLERWKYNSSANASSIETVSCLAAVEGVSDFIGLKTEARSVANVSTEWMAISFSEPFNEAPVIFANAASNTKDYPVVVRVRNVTATGFEMRLTREKKETDRARSNVGWIAIAKGTVQVGDQKIKVGVVNNVGELSGRQKIDFGGTYSNPMFLTTIQTSNDDYTYGVRYSALNESGVIVYKQLEKSMGNSYYTGVQADDLGYVVISNDQSSSLPLVSGAIHSALKIYPSIAKDLLTVLEDPSVFVNVISLDGNVVLSAPIGDGVLDVSQLASGIYLLTTSNGKTGRFIKK